MAKTYACCYCGEKLRKELLVKHIEKNHEEELEPGYTAYRKVYDIMYDKHGHGNCIVCGYPTKWNEKRQKYNRLCGNPKCDKEIRKIYENRMIRVYNKTTLLNDPNIQEKMLSNRRISGKYTWSDGKIFTYTGSYEKALLEFLDQTMEFKSNEIISPGPVLYYEYKGKKHHWITDLLILPYNLIIEVKDENAADKRRSEEYREKTVAKELMITEKGKFHYLRLTGHNHNQLLSTLAELKKRCIDDNKEMFIKINEDNEYYEHLVSESDMMSNILYNYLNENKLVDMVSFDYYNMIILDEEEKEMILSFNLFPRYINKEVIFSNIVNESIDYLSSIYKNDLMYEYINEDNILDGIMIGIRA